MHTRLRCLAPAVVFASSLIAPGLLSPELLAQSGGFQDGDMYLYTRSVSGSTFADGGLIHIEPQSGQTQLMFGFDYSSLRTGAAAFDSYRKRVVFSASIGDPLGFGTFSLFSTDADGTIETLLHPAKSFVGLSPTGDGRIYLADPYDVFKPFQWLDASNRLHTLTEADGTTSFTFQGFANQSGCAMTYDPATNALFVAVSTLYGASCDGSGGSDITIRKIPLSADGTKVAGPVTCTQVDVDLNQATEKPVNWSRGPGGSLLLVVDNVNLTYDFDRVLKIDPATFSVTSFVKNGGYLGAADGTAGAYSSVLGKAVIVDTRNDVLRAFAEGEGGAGTVITPTGPLSWNPGSNEVATLLEIDNGACDGGFQAFGIGLAGTGNATPSLHASGCAAIGDSMSAHINGVVGGATGYVLLGLNQANIPYKTGAIYVSPILSFLPVTVGGAHGSAGAGSIDIPFGTLSDPALAGLDIIMQAAFQDLGVPYGVSLTQGLRIEID